MKLPKIEKLSILHGKYYSFDLVTSFFGHTQRNVSVNIRVDSETKVGFFVKATTICTPDYNATIINGVLVLQMRTLLLLATWTYVKVVCKNNNMKYVWQSYF